MHAAVFADASLLRRFVDAFCDVVSEADFVFAADGIEVRAIDGPSVVFVSARLHATILARYDAPEPLTVGVPLRRLARLLACGDRDGEITLEPTVERLTITVGAPDGRSMSMSLPTVPPSFASFGAAVAPARGVRATLASAEFARTVKDMQGFADVARFTGAGTTLRVEALGHAGTARVTYLSKNKQSVECSADASTVLALRFLSAACRAAPLARAVHIAFGQDTPAAIEFRLANESHVTFYVAPQFAEGA